MFFCMLLILAGCSFNDATIDYLTAANARLASAQKNGAEQLAKPEIDEARSLYNEAELAFQKKDKEAVSISQKAFAKARLAEALAKQAKAEAEVEKSREALRKATEEANRASKERIAAENELNRMN